MAPATYKGLRKPDDPIYKQITIVIGPVARQKPKDTSDKTEPVEKPPVDDPSRSSKNEGRSS